VILEFVVVIAKSVVASGVGDHLFVKFRASLIPVGANKWDDVPQGLGKYSGTNEVADLVADDMLRGENLWRKLHMTFQLNLVIHFPLLFFRHPYVNQPSYSKAFQPFP